MYDYGWRMYMPDIARWNGMDQLSEKFVSSSPYAYVMNNPVMFTDPDGRDKKPSGNWLQDMWDATDSYSYWTNTGNGYFTGGEKDGGMSHENFTAFYNFLAGGGTGYYTYWTGGARTSYFSNGEGNGTVDMTIHKIYIKGSDNSFKDWANGSLTAMSTLYDFIADQRKNLYDSGYWIDNLGNTRSVKYWGRGKGSLIGLQKDYIKTTAKFSRYAKIFGVAGVAIGAAYDVQGVNAYRNNTNSPDAVNPVKAVVNTVMGTYGLTGAGTIPSLLYGGIDAFYPGGWTGASITAERTERYEQSTTGHPFFSNSAIKF